MHSYIQDYIYIKYIHSMHTHTDHAYWPYTSVHKYIPYTHTHHTYTHALATGEQLRVKLEKIH